MVGLTHALNMLSFMLVSTYSILSKLDCMEPVTVTVSDYTALIHTVTFIQLFDCIIVLLKYLAVWRFMNNGY